MNIRHGEHDYCISGQCPICNDDLMTISDIKRELEKLEQEERELREKKLLGEKNERLY